MNIVQEEAALCLIAAPFLLLLGLIVNALIDRIWPPDDNDNPPQSGEE